MAMGKDQTRYQDVLPNVMANPPRGGMSWTIGFLQKD
jgi:hypothetical protein